MLNWMFHVSKQESQPRRPLFSCSGRDDSRDELDEPQDSGDAEDAGDLDEAQHPRAAGGGVGRVVQASLWARCVSSILWPERS